MYTICILVLRKKGQDKVAIEYCFLLNKILYGFLIRKILEYCEVYKEVTALVVHGKPMDLKSFSQEHFKFDKKEKKWHKTSKEKADEEQALILEGPGLDPKIDKVLLKTVDIIKLLAHQTNEHYLDLSNRLKKVEERMITRIEEVIVKEVQTLKDNVKVLHNDIKNVRILVKNIYTSNC